MGLLLWHCWTAEFWTICKWQPMVSALAQQHLQASMLEIYNEDIRDLLSRKKDDSRKHQVRPPPGSR